MTPNLLPHLLPHFGSDKGGFDGIAWYRKAPKIPRFFKAFETSLDELGRKVMPLAGHPDTFQISDTARLAAHGRDKASSALRRPLRAEEKASVPVARIEASQAVEDRIAKLWSLKESGALTEAEFTTAKLELLGAGPAKMIPASGVADSGA